MDPSFHCLSETLAARHVGTYLGAYVCSWLSLPDPGQVYIWLCSCAGFEAQREPGAVLQRACISWRLPSCPHLPPSFLSFLIMGPRQVPACGGQRRPAVASLKTSRRVSVVSEHMQHALWAGRRMVRHGGKIQDSLSLPVSRLKPDPHPRQLQPSLPTHTHTLSLPYAQRSAPSADLNDSEGGRAAVFLLPPRSTAWAKFGHEFPEGCPLLTTTRAAQPSLWVDGDHNRAPPIQPGRPLPSRMPCHKVGGPSTTPLSRRPVAPRSRNGGLAVVRLSRCIR